MQRIGQVADADSIDAEPTEAHDVNELVARAMQQIRDEFAPRTGECLLGR